MFFEIGRYFAITQYKRRFWTCEHRDCDRTNLLRRYLTAAFRGCFRPDQRSPSSLDARNDAEGAGQSFPVIKEAG